jgi:hypothetical protein
MLAVASSVYTPDLANGLTTFNAGGCSSCHAVPDQPDRTRLGGGLAIPSPFATFYAPNISPDPVDGIGRWSEAEFVGTVTQGISPAGFHDFPAFPYTSYQHARVSPFLLWHRGSTREDALTMRVLILRSPLFPSDPIEQQC